MKIWDTEQVREIGASVHSNRMESKNGDGNREKRLQPLDRAFFMEKFEELTRALTQVRDTVCNLEKKLEVGQFSTMRDRNISKQQEHINESERDEESADNVGRWIPLRNRQVVTTNKDKRVKRDGEKTRQLQLELLMVELREVGRASYPSEEERRKDLIRIVNQEKEIRFLQERYRAATESMLEPENEETEGMPNTMGKGPLKMVGNKEIRQKDIPMAKKGRKTSKITQMERETDLQSNDERVRRQEDGEVHMQQEVLQAESEETGRKSHVLQDQRGNKPLKVMRQEVEIQSPQHGCKAVPKKAEGGELIDGNRVENRLKTTTERREMKPLRKTQELNESAGTIKIEQALKKGITEAQTYETKPKEESEKDVQKVRLERKCNEEQPDEKLGENRKQDEEQKRKKAVDECGNLEKQTQTNGKVVVEKRVLKVRGSVQHQEHEVILVEQVTIGKVLKPLDVDPQKVTEEKKNAVAQMQEGTLGAYVPWKETQKVIRKEQAMLTLSHQINTQQEEKRDQENLKVYERLQQPEIEVMMEERKKVENQKRRKEQEPQPITEEKNTHTPAVKRGTMETNDSLFLEVDMLLDNMDVGSESEVKVMPPGETEKQERESTEGVPKEIKNEDQSRQSRELEKQIVTGGKMEDEARLKNGKNDDLFLEVETLLIDMEEENDSSEARVRLTKTTGKEGKQRDNAKPVNVPSKHDDTNPQVHEVKMGQSRPKWLEAWGEARMTEECKSNSQWKMSPLETDDTVFTSLQRQRKEGRRKASIEVGDQNSVLWFEKAIDVTDTQELREQKDKQEEMEAGNMHVQMREMDFKRQDQADKLKNEERKGVEERLKEEERNREERLKEEEMLRSAQRVRERDDDMTTFLDEMDVRRKEKEKKREERQRKVDEANRIWSPLPVRSDDSDINETVGAERTQRKGGEKKKVRFQIKLSNTKWWLNEDDDAQSS